MPMLWWWLAFHDDDKMLGVVIAPGLTVSDALHCCHHDGTNPGGSAHVQPVLERHAHEFKQQRLTRRLLDQEEAIYCEEIVKINPARKSEQAYMEKLMEETD